MNNSFEEQEQIIEQNDIEEVAKDYGNLQYWQERYKEREGERYDWLQNYEALQTIIEEQLQGKKNAKILNVGCGNGQIQDKLYEAGYHHIINNDFSKIVIQEMERIRKQKGYDHMQYQIMDVTDMKYSQKQFDLVLDKSTIDALLCSDSPYISTAKMLSQIQRVLKDDGIYMAISYGSPETRMSHLKRQHVFFDIKLKEVEKIAIDGGKIMHYVYICSKKPEKPKRSSEWYKKFYQKLEQEEREQNY